LPYASDYSGSFSAQYVFDLGSLGQVTPLAVLTFSSGFYGQPANSILDKQDAYTKIDLRVTWDINDNLSVAGFVNNVTDEATATRFVWGGGGAMQASYAPPKLWGIKASLRF
jgi:iron complex outermembrane receptor protein